MTTDLACLVATALWGFLLVMIEISAKTREAGVAWNAGNRESTPTFSPWVQRTALAISNHKENFPFFLTAVLVVHLAGKSDRTSAIAAVVFVLARALHGLLYIGGVKGARSAAFGLSIAAVFVILSRLVM